MISLPSRNQGFILLTPAQAAIVILGSILISMLLTLAITYLILKSRRKTVRTQQLIEQSIGLSSFNSRKDVTDDPKISTRSKSKPLTSNPIIPPKQIVNGRQSPSARIIDARTGALTPESMYRLQPPVDQSRIMSESLAAVHEDINRAIKVPSRARLFIPPSPGTPRTPRRIPRRQTRRFEKGSKDDIDEILPWEGIPVPDMPDEYEVFEKENGIRVKTDLLM